MATKTMTSDDNSRLRKAFILLDDMHREAPVGDAAGPSNILASLDYHQQLSSWVDQLAPEASIALRLAARSQHVRRWSIPRNSYPMNRKGYRNWRNALTQFHVRTTAEVLVQVGYDAETIARVEQLLRKHRIGKDPEAQTLEDAVCLVFLEIQLDDFSRQHSEEKLLHILRRTWKKMSPTGHRLALHLKLPEEAASLLRSALEGA